MHRTLGAALLTVAAADGDVPWRVFTFIFTGAVGLYSWFSRRQSVDREHVVRLERSVAVIEERISHMPSAAQLAELEKTIATFSEQQRSVGNDLKRIDHTMRRMQEYLEKGS